MLKKLTLAAFAVGLALSMSGAAEARMHHRHMHRMHHMHHMMHHHGHHCMMHHRHCR